MRILERLLYALIAVWFAFQTVIAIITPERYTLFDVTEYALFAALGAVWLWDSFSPIEGRYTLILSAVTFTWGALTPSYSFINGLFGIVAGFTLITAIVLWAEYRRERKTRAAIEEYLRDHVATPGDAEASRLAREWLENHDDKR